MADVRTACTRPTQRVGRRGDLLGFVHEAEPPSPVGLNEARLPGIVSQRLTQVAQRMGELRRVQKVLRASLAECLEHEESGRCRVVDELTASARTRS